MSRKEMEALEKKTINICIFFVFVMAASGVIFGFLAGSSAILLDGIFSSVLLVTVFFSKIVQNYVSRPASHTYPTGFNRLESLYILFKILILIGILTFSLLHSVETIFAFYVHDIVPGSIDQFYANIYYVVKIVAFVCAFVIYSNAIKKTNNKSALLKIERKGVMIDGGITIGIMLGLIVIPILGFPKELADSIVLLVLSIFLLVVMVKDLKDEIKLIVNKRMYEKEEKEYIKYFNSTIPNFIIDDLFIFKSAKQTYAYVEIEFNDYHSITELRNAEDVMKDEMQKDFGDVVLLYSFTDQLL